MKSVECGYERTLEFVILIDIRLGAHEFMVQAITYDGQVPIDIEIIP